MNCSHAFFFAKASLAFVSGLRTHLSKSAILDRVIFVRYKMVVLTLVTKKNGEAIFLDQAIPQVHFMKLISCSLYNSWDTLKKQSIAIMGEETNPIETSTIPPGHYTLQNLTELIDGMFPSSFVTHLKTKTNTAKALLEIEKKLEQKIRFGPDFAKLIGIDGALKKITNVKRLRYPSAYFIHCDLIDKNYNFFNNKKSDLQAKIDVRGKAYEKVRYDASPQQLIRDCSTDSHVNSIKISVRDENGELFDFKDMPLEFELELN